MSTTALLLTSALFMGMLAPSSTSPISGPFHAFCEVLWLFGLPCDEITTKLTQQIDAFSPVNMCDECEYMLISSTAAAVRANHTSIDGLEVEILSFTLSPTVAPGGCRVSGESRSLSFTSLLDTGTNYCNLYNLLLASGLISAPGFLEMTNEWSCLGYSLAPCKDLWLEKMLQ